MPSSDLVSRLGGVEKRALRSTPARRSQGLHRALIVLVDILEMLDSGGFMDKTSRSTVDVSLKDLAEFVEDAFLMGVGGYLSLCTKGRANRRMHVWIAFDVVRDVVHGCTLFVSSI